MRKSIWNLLPLAMLQVAAASPMENGFAWNGDPTHNSSEQDWIAFGSRHRSYHPLLNGAQAEKSRESALSVFATASVATSAGEGAGLTPAADSVDTMAPPPAVPEPSTLWYGVMGISMLTGLKIRSSWRRRVRQPA